MTVVESEVMSNPELRMDDKLVKKLNSDKNSFKQRFNVLLLSLPRESKQLYGNFFFIGRK